VPKNIPIEGSAKSCNLGRGLVILVAVNASPPIAAMAARIAAQRWWDVILKLDKRLAIAEFRRER